MSSRRVARFACAWLLCTLGAGHVACSGAPVSLFGDAGADDPSDATVRDDVGAASDDAGPPDATAENADADAGRDATLVDDAHADVDAQGEGEGEGERDAARDGRADPTTDASSEGGSGDAGAEAGLDASPDAALDSGGDALDATLDDASATDASAADASPGDAAPDAPDEGAAATDDGGAQTVTLTMDAFSVPANSEVDVCQPMGNPFGQAVDLVSSDGFASSGVSAFFLDNMGPETSRNTTAPPAHCPGEGLHPFAYFSQQPGHFVESYPQANMGYALAADHGLMFHVHYVNVGAQPISPTVTIVLKTAAAGTVTTHVGHIVLDNASFSVPPTAKKDAATYTAQWVPTTGQMPASYALFRSWSRMFQYGLEFQAGSGTTAFYDQTEWNVPAVFAHQPPIAMTGSTSIGWACTYYNPTTATMNAGPSPRTDDQCRYIGTYAVAGASAPDVLVTQ